MRSIACISFLAVSVLFPSFAIAQAAPSSSDSTKNEPTKAVGENLKAKSESPKPKTKKAAGLPKGGGPFDPTTIALNAVLKINQIHTNVEELKKNSNEQKQGNLYLEIGLAVVATLGLLLGLAALWQTIKLQRRLLEHTTHKGSEMH